ncbi:MAG: hypothetical protein IJW37_08195 [Lachnospiraceae bacterium]|nr:hypothetical protein [Lachnospiraceae bacterium]
MSARFRKNEGSRKGLGRWLTLGLTVGTLVCTAACGGGKGEEEATAAPTASVVEIPGFEDANKDLVREMAKKHGETVAVTVGDEVIAMDKAMFFIYSMEVRGNYYSTYYEAQYGTDYWEMVYDDEGKTTREVFKEQTMNTLIQYAVLYDCAVKNGMTLSVADQEANNAYVEQIKEALTAEEAERGGFTTDVLREVCAWMMLAEKYYDKMTEGLGITRESVSESIYKEDYKEYETEYIYLATTYYDENYELQEETTELKEAYALQMAEYYEEVGNGMTFEEIAEREEALVHETRTFLADGTGAEEAYVAAAAKLAVGEVSEPIQTEYGIYLIRMIDDDCTKSYEAAVDAAYEAERSEAFDAAYQVLLSQYPVEINEEAWGDIILGATVSLIE